MNTFWSKSTSLFYLPRADKVGFQQMLRNRCERNAVAEFEKITLEADRIRIRITEIDRFVQGLFESKVKGEIDGDMFCNFSDSYRKEKAELNAKLEVLMEKEELLKKDAGKSAMLGTNVNKYDIVSEITPEVLRDFIEKIEIGDETGEYKYRKKVRKIKVFFIGIGEF